MAIHDQAGRLVAVVAAAVKSKALYYRAGYTPLHPPSFSLWSIVSKNSVWNFSRYINDLTIILSPKKTVKVLSLGFLPEIAEKTNSPDVSN